MFLKTSLLLVGVFLSPIKALVPEVEEENLSTHRPILPIGIEGSMEKFFEYARSGSPLIQEYLQNGINVFYKPTFILDPTLHKQPLTVENEDCVKPLGPSYPEGIDEPVRILETIDNNVDGEVRRIIDIIPGPKAMLPMPAASPVLVEEPMVVQELPILPPQVQPELATKEVIIETTKISKTDIPALPESVSFVIEEPVLISEAPVLPPLILPEIQLPTLPAKDGVAVKTTNVPEPPFLPPMPESLPVIVEEPVMIPEGPVLPPLVLPEFPIPTMIKPVEDEVVVESLTVSEPSHLPSIPESVPILIEEPVMIPESPLPPSLILPEIPTPSLIEPVKVGETAETLNIAETPMPESIPVLVEEPVIMPESPVLLPQILSEIPAPITIEPAQVKVLIETMNVSEVPSLLPEAVSIIPEELPLEISLPIETELPTILEESLPSKLEVPEIIPDAPIFPLLNMPEIPTIVDIIPPPTPELPIMPMPVPSATLPEALPELDGPIPMLVEATPALKEEPMFIPEAPILPPFEMPQLPEPVLIKEQVTVSNSEKSDSNPQAVIPPLPMLPPFQVPSFPLLVQPSQSPCPEYTSMPVPSPAGFPVFVVPNMPNMPVPYQTALPMIPLVPAFSGNVPLTKEMIEQDKMSMSSLPLTILFPKSCVQEIVVERVLPNIACEKKMMVPASNPVSTIRVV